MPGTEWQHQREVREALHTIVSDPQLGPPALSNAQVMTNLLKDLLPDAPRETSVLVAAAEAGLPQILLDHVGQGIDAATAASLAASAFAARTPFTPEACDWVVAELSVALGIAPGEPRAAGPGAAGSQSLTGAPVPRGIAETLPAQGAGHAPAAGPGHAPAAGSGYAPGAGPGYGGPVAQPAMRPTVADYAPGYGRPAGRGYGSPAGPGQPAPGYGSPAGPGQSGPGKRKSTKTWGIVTAAIVGIAVLGGIIAMVTHIGAITTAEPLSQLIGPDVTSCKTGVVTGMHGVTAAQSCHTRAQGIGLVGYQFGTAADYQAGLAELNLLTGFDTAAAGHGCPPPSGGTGGQAPWHSNGNSSFGPRAGQILECYRYNRDSTPIYLWTLPTQRVILIANDQAAGANYTSLGTWWSGLSYG